MIHDNIYFQFHGIKSSMYEIIINTKFHQKHMLEKNHYNIHVIFFSCVHAIICLKISWKLVLDIIFIPCCPFQLILDEGFSQFKSRNWITNHFSVIFYTRRVKNFNFYLFHVFRSFCCILPLSFMSFMYTFIFFLYRLLFLISPQP